jgi:drug/metabolite transporter (DMT)-like permease
MDNIEPIDLVLLFSGIMLCFFMPGYAIVLFITKKRKVNPFLTVLLAYLLSMLITGATSILQHYILIIPISESKTLFIAVYISVLVTLCMYYLVNRISLPINQRIDYCSSYHVIISHVIKFKKFLKTNATSFS